MDVNSYWSNRLARRQLSRRRLLSGAATLTAAGTALSLIGCGGGDDGVEGDASGLLGRVEDTTKSAKPGGTWMDSFGTDITHMDLGIEQIVALRNQGRPVYQNLL